MLQITKDRLFALGLQVPAAVQIRGDTAAVEWADQELTKAAELGGQPARVTDQLTAIQEKEDRGEYGGEALPVVTLSEILAEVNLVQILEGVHTAAAELLEIAQRGTNGHEEVIGRLGEIPAMTEFLAWARAAASAPPESGAAEVEAGGVTEDGPAAPAEEDAPAGGSHAPEELEALDAELAAREETDAPTREGAEVTTSTAEEAPAAANPGVGDPPSWGMELEAVKERLAALERVVNSLGA